MQNMLNFMNNKVTSSNKKLTTVSTEGTPNFSPQRALYTDKTNNKNNGNNTNII